MSEQEMLFYKEYERFYAMTETSEAFREFCMQAFGADFSQDGFSDIELSALGKGSAYFGYRMWEWKDAWLSADKSKSIYTWF